MKRTVLYVILGIVLVGGVVGALVWRSRGTGQSQEGDRSAVVKRGTMVVAVSASGSIEPQTRADLAFEAPGKVAEVLVQEEDRVEAGDVLLRLDRERLALQVQQAEASLASAEAQLAQLRSGPRSEEVASAEADVRAAGAGVSAAAANRDQLEDGADDAQVAAAEADLASAITQQKIADDRHEATMRCFSFSLPAGKPVTLPDGTVITLTERLEETFCPALGVPEEQARYSLRAADAGLAAARLRLDELLDGPDAEQVRAARANVWSASAQRDAVQAQLDLLLEGATGEQVAAAEAGVEQARAALQQAELSLEQATLSAPFDGVVAAVNVTSGEIASTLPAITLVDTSSFHVAVSVDEIDVGRLAGGQSADVTLDAFPDVVVPGVIERIAPAATLEGGVVYYDVVVELGRTDVAVRAGMTANASIVVDELADVLTIPTWVVRVDRSAGQTYVQRRTADGDVERVDVVLGVRREGVAQVLGGLAEGDEVVWVQDDPFDFEPR